jgi:nucleoside-triphosphatase THEP1
MGEWDRDKVRIIITGEKGIGKTAVCEKVVNEIRIRDEMRVGGILCPDTEVGKEIVDIASGEEAEFADRKGNGGYAIKSEGIRFGIAAIERALNLDLVVIDEIGPLEFKGNGNGFSDILKEVLKKDRVIIVVRSSLCPRFVERFGNDFRIFEVREANRDGIWKEIV